MKDGRLMKETDAEELLTKYMHILGDKQSEKTYRLKSSTGDGIMRNYTVAKGIDIIYSEIESYYPIPVDVKKSVKFVEIMYMVEGHADFEMENRRVASADKGDVCIFNNRVGTRKCVLHKGGMRCVSIVVLIDSLKKELSRMFETKEFEGKALFENVSNSDSCICFPANEMLKNIFTALLQIPDKYGDYYRRILTVQALLALMDTDNARSTDYRYFSGDVGNKVHEARKILGENLASSITVEELAERVNLNRTTLQRVFKQMYGMTTFEYRTHVRMQEAKNMLLTDTMSVTDIAGSCGYANASKFSAAFKKVFGQTPMGWKSGNT